LFRLLDLLQARRHLTGLVPFVQLYCGNGSRESSGANRNGLGPRSRPKQKIHCTRQHGWHCYGIIVIQKQSLIPLFPLFRFPYSVSLISIP
jgi:hypothetical protein